MMRLIALTLLIAAFAGGYCVANLPDAPDILAWLDENVQQTRQEGDRPAEAATQAPIEQASPAPSVQPPDQIIVEVGGKLYRVGNDALAKR